MLKLAPASALFRIVPEFRAKIYSSGSGTRVQYNALAIRSEFGRIEARTTWSKHETPAACHQSLKLSAPVYDGRIACRIRRERENWRISEAGPQESVVVGIVELGKRFRGIIGPKFTASP